MVSIYHRSRGVSYLILLNLFLFCLELPISGKGSKHAQKSRICCLRLRPDETHQDQRQQLRLKNQDFAASAFDPVKPTRTKGSNFVSKSRFCCFRLRPDETHQEQRQQPLHAQSADVRGDRIFPQNKNDHHSDVHLLSSCRQRPRSAASSNMQLPIFRIRIFCSRKGDGSFHVKSPREKNRL